MPDSTPTLNAKIQYPITKITKPESNQKPEIATACMEKLNSGHTNLVLPKSTFLMQTAH